MRLLYTETQIQDAVNKIVSTIVTIENNSTSPPVFICVLNGAFMFFTDLVKAYPGDCEIDFIKVKSYQNQEQFEIEIKSDISLDIEKKSLYIIDDILDSGKTMLELVKHFEHKKPYSITPITLFKRSTNHWPIIHGIELENESWLIGYGLDDINGLKRNQTQIFGKSEEID